MLLNAILFGALVVMIVVDFFFLMLVFDAISANSLPFAFARCVLLFLSAIGTYILFAYWQTL